MRHLNVEQIENYVAGRDRRLDAHVATCEHCRSELALDRRLTLALGHLERISPSSEFTARLERTVTRAEEAALESAVKIRMPSFAWTGLAALLASLLLVVFAYQTVIALQEGGTLDFVSLYASRPDLISMYPTESLGALIESLPLVEFLLTLGLLVIAVVLAQQFMLARRSIARFMQKGER